MALTERTIVDRIEILPETGHVQIREAIIISRDNDEVSRGFHRVAIESGDMALLISKLGSDRAASVAESAGWNS